MRRVRFIGGGGQHFTYLGFKASAPYHQINCRCSFVKAILSSLYTAGSGPGLACRV